ncbi:MAG TPA: hypothetical protein VGT03_04875 [Candidatus Acidoferrales bacterium]|nr:hypothetical protein [Candidatus Acidoferrales bacterium]
MTRRDFQKLARTRIKEGRILLRANAPGGAYYLLGLAVESALKACIAKKTRRFEFPEKSVVNQSYSHDLNKLLAVAGLEASIDDLSVTNQDIATNWAVVKDWTIESRYQNHDAKKASDLCKAITDRTNGVLKCIQQYW